MVKTATVLCPDCGTALRMETNVFGKWKSTTCPKCKKRILPETMHESTIYCKKCRRDVAVDLLASDCAVCPACHSVLSLPAQKASERKVTCPYCRMDMVIDGEHELVRIECSFCKRLFSVEDGVLANSTKDTEIAMRITNEGMSTDDVVWRYPYTAFSTKSTIELQPGTVALLVDGNECVGLVSHSGGTIDSYMENSERPGVVTGIVFIRKKLNRQLLCGVGTLQIQDDRFIVRHNSQIGTHCTLKVEIRDVVTFAQKVGFRNCTENDIGLRNPRSAENPAINSAFPQITIDVQRDLNTACDTILRKQGCGILGLRGCSVDIADEFARLAEGELLAEWGIHVSSCAIGGMHIDNSMLEPLNPSSAIVTQEITWGPLEATVYMNNELELRAVVAVSGTVQMKIDDEGRLQAHGDWGRWMLNPEEAKRDIARFVNQYISGVLPSVIQASINMANADIREIPRYNYGIMNRLRDHFASDQANSYLYSHGLAVNTLTANADVKSVSEALEKYYEVKLSNVTSNLDVEDKEIKKQKEVKISQIEMKGNAQIERDKIAFGDQVEQDRFDAELNKLNREKKLQDLKDENQHKRNMDELRRKEEAQKLSDENRMAGAVRDNDFNRFTDNTEREREEAAQRHEGLMNEMLLSIEQSKLSFQEKLDAYVRMKQVQDAISGADAQRATAQGSADMLLIAKQGELKISREAQELMEKAAQAEQARKESEKNAQLERDIKLRHETLAAELERLRLQEEIRQATQQSEEKMHAMQMEVEKLRIMVNCYEEQLKREAETSRANAAAAKARSDAEREYTQRQREQQQRHDKEMQKKYENQRMQQNEDRKHLEKMLGELTRLQGELNRGVKPRNGELDDATSRMNDLTRAVQDLLVKMNGGSPAGVRYDDARQTYGGKTPDLSQQPGVSIAGRCLSCGITLDPHAAICPGCGTRVPR